MIRLRYLGTADIIIHDKSILQELSQKGAGLLFYLCGVQNNQFSRDQIATMFWPGYKKESSLSNLRFTLWKIRKVLKSYGFSDVISNEGKKYIKVDPSYMSSDFMDFLSHIKNNAYYEASLYYNGPFLDDFYLYDVPDFSNWVFNEREFYERTHYNAQLSLAKHYAKEGFIGKATDLLHDLINLDPLNESTYLTLITYLYESGNKVAAINTFRKVKQLLRDELNVSPSEELQTLAQNILNTHSTMDSEMPEFTLSTEGITAYDRRLIFYSSKNDGKENNYMSHLIQHQSHAESFLIDICDTPGYRVNYEGIFEVLDDVEEKGQYNPKLWQDKYAEIISTIRNNPIDNDLYLFKRIIDVLNGECSRTHIIRIWNLHWLDDKTVDFLSYLYRHHQEKELIITGIVQEDLLSNRIKAFLDAHESLNEFSLE